MYKMAETIFLPFEIWENQPMISTPENQIVTLITSRQHMYLGSANLGTRCTSYTKEIGMMVNYNC